MYFEERLEKCSIPLLRKLFNIIITKKTTLCVAADFKDLARIVQLAEKVGPHICILKLHTAFFVPVSRNQDGYDENFAALLECKKKYNFLLFDDPKFSDGYETVKTSYENCGRFFDLVTVMANGGDYIFRAIEDGSKSLDLPDDEPRGCLAVCELSFKGFVQPSGFELLNIAKRNQPVCIGIIGQKLQVEDKNNMIKVTPGISFSSSSDSKNQQWRGPESAVKDGSDIIIVGRGITAAPEDQWETLAIEYKDRCYKAYLDAVKNVQ